MDALKVGIREFRNQLPHYLLKAGQAIAITRHGETIGYFIPSRDTKPASEIDKLKIAAAKLDALLQSSGVDTERVVAEFNARRRRKS